jgi:hypothetical protein
MHKLTQILLEATITPRAAACKKDVLNHFGQNAFTGVEVFNYRTKRGSTSMSPHAIGNAIDFRVSKPYIGDAENVTASQKKLGDDTLNYLLNNADRLAIQTIIWFKKSYSRPSFKATNYTGKHAHYDHVHVDFVPEHKNDFKKSTLSNEVNTNKYLVGLIHAYYDISTINPELYFKDFRSWNPFAPGIGDNEEGASDKLISRFLALYEPKLKELERNPKTSPQDLNNIQIIRNIVDALNESILNGVSKKFIVTYYVFDKSTNTYKTKTLTFNWNYL